MWCIVKTYTQTVLHTENENGDCWATGMECVLDLPLGTLPRWERDQAGSLSHQAVMVYLAHHYGLWSQRIDASCHERVSVKGPHLINGDSPRFPGLGHTVVGMDGVPVHDPHPDRTFVTRVKEWEVLVPIPEDARGWYYYLNRLACPCGCTMPQIEAWWNALAYKDAQKVMRKAQTVQELERIQSDRAARRWWGTLPDNRKTEVWSHRPEGM